MPTRLERSTRNKVVAGVCGGIGEYLQVDPTLVRVTDPASGEDVRIAEDVPFSAIVVDGLQAVVDLTNIEPSAFDVDWTTVARPPISSRMYSPRLLP